MVKEVWPNIFYLSSTSSCFLSEFGIVPREGKIWIFGGLDEMEEPLSTIETFDGTEWTEESLTLPVPFITVVAVNTKDAVFLLGWPEDKGSPRVSVKLIKQLIARLPPPSCRAIFGDWI